MPEVPPFPRRSHSGVNAAVAIGMIACVAAVTHVVAAGSGPVSIDVTGRTLSFNGTTMVPAGLFGVHASDLDEDRARDWGVELVRVIDYEPDGRPARPGVHGDIPSNVTRVVDCLFDRYQPATLLMYRDWKERLQTLARAYASNAPPTGTDYVLEFWNEPYLNWAARPGINLDGFWFDAQDGDRSRPPRLRTTGEVFDGLAWDSNKLFAVRLDKKRVHYVATRYIDDFRKRGQYPAGKEWKPFEYREGFEFTYEGVLCRLQWVPWVNDLGQKKYYAGPFNESVYNRMLEVFGKELKAANPGLPLVAGWGCNMWSDDWLAWRTLYQPTIDKNHGWIDGIHEHHYGTDVRQLATSYEVAYAYALTRFGKSLKFYNTEAGGMLDPEKPEGPKTSHAGTPLEKKIGAFTFMVRDIIHLLNMCPDKAVTRAAHGASWEPGTVLAFQFLKDLRGRLLQVRSSTPMVSAVASLQDTRMCVVLFNDAPGSRTIRVSISAPGDTTLVQAHQVTPVRTADSLSLTSSPVNVQGATTLEQTLEMPRRSAVKWMLALDHAPTNAAPVSILQYPAPQILVNAGPTNPAQFVVTIPPAELARADKAWMRLNHYGLGAPHTGVLNGRQIPATPDTSWWHVQELDPAWLSATNPVSFSASGSGNPTFTIHTLSILLESDPRMK
jgi:hypothetical protein